MEYLMTSAMETNNQKKVRLQKIGEKPMKSYTKIEWRAGRGQTADVVTTSLEALANVVPWSSGVLPDVVATSSEALAEATTFLDARAEEEHIKCTVAV